jgi:hypothetical protein
MRVLTPTVQKKPSSRQLSTAAENVASAQFAMYGFNVLEQGPRARYFHDLGVANSSRMMRVTVYGSFGGFWKLVDLFAGHATQDRTGAGYHRAIDRWLKRQGRRVTFCLVQFESTDVTCVPRLYLATAAEIAARLHASVEQLGDTALYEQYEVEDDRGRHTVETLPSHWQFSEQRIAELMANEARPLVEFKFSEAAACAACAAAKPVRQHCVHMMN